MKFKSNKKDVLKSLNDAEIRVLLGIGEFAEGAVKSLTPVKTNALRGSITHKVVENERKLVIGSDLTDEDYPIYVEKGTSKMSAQPYLAPGVEGNIPQIKAIAERLFKL